MSIPVYTATIRNGQPENLYASFSEADLTAQLADYCRQRWLDHMEGTLPGDDEQCVEEYFDSESPSGETITYSSFHIRVGSLLRIGKEPDSLVPPDPDNQNDDRAEWADVALTAFRSVTRMQDENDLLVVADLLCDLHHWCDRNNLDYSTAHAWAEGHYKEETSEDYPSA